MKSRIKSYLVFTSRLYRLVLFVGVPIVILLLQFLLREPDYFLVALLTILGLVSAEICLDYWAFGGIAVKGGTQLEYLKSSKRGVGVVGTALGVNMARQFLTGVLLFGVSAAITVCRGGMIETGARWISIYTDILLLGYVLITISLTAVRYFDGIAVNLVAVSICCLVLTGGLILIALSPYIMLAVLAVLAGVTSCLGVWLVVRRVKESYYDKAV